MKYQAKLAGTGVVCSLGSDLPSILDKLDQGAGSFDTYALTGFDSDIIVPYLQASDASLTAEQRIPELVAKALDQALSSVPLTAQERKNTPIFVGSSSFGIGIGEERYQTALASDEEAYPLPLNGFTQVSQYLRSEHGFTGSDFTFNTACTASANAILSATNALRTGLYEYALVVGIETRNKTTLSGFHGMQMLSDQAMKPFDKHRNGLVLGEGCAVLILQRQESIDSGISVCGGASLSDSYSISASNPDGSAISEVMGSGLNNCEITATQIRALKAHGTATFLNDEGEAAGMRNVFNPVPDFSSLKSYIGHTLGGCGAIETAIFSACIERGTIPKSAGFTDLDENLAVIPLTESKRSEPGHYMLNFFGFGGNNCSLITQLHR